MSGLARRIHEGNRRLRPAVLWLPVAIASVAIVSFVLLVDDRPTAAQTGFSCSVSIDDRNPNRSQWINVTIQVTDNEPDYYGQFLGLTREGSPVPDSQVTRDGNTYRYRHFVFGNPRTISLSASFAILSVIESTGDLTGTVDEGSPGGNIDEGAIVDGGSGLASFQTGGFGCANSFTIQSASVGFDNTEPQRGESIVLSGQGYPLGGGALVLPVNTTACSEAAGEFVRADSAGRFSQRIDLSPTMAPGRYTVVVCTLVGEFSYAPEASASFTVVNADPEVTITAPESVVRGQPVRVTASVTDPDDEPTEVSWELLDSDGTVLDSQTGGLTYSVDPADVPEIVEVGSYTVVATATDELGGEDRADFTFAIENAEPTISIDCPSTARFAQAVEIPATVTDDVDGTVVAWTTSLGDEGTGTSFVPDLDRAGDVEITATATDSDGATASDACTIGVAARPTTSETTEDPDPPPSSDPTETTDTTEEPDETTETDPEAPSTSDTTIATSTPTTEGPDDDGGIGTPGQVGLGLGALAAAGGAVIVGARRRRPDAPDPAGAPPDPCATPRQVSDRADQEAIIARQEADTAAEAVFHAEANLSEMQARLAECEGPAGDRSTFGAVPFAPRRDRQPPVAAEDYVLLTVPNPNAPLTGSGQGWYHFRPDRKVDAIVVHSVQPEILPDGLQSAAGAAAFLTMTDIEMSAHAAVDGRGAIELLPSSTHDARHTPSHDATTAAVMVVAPSGPWGDGLLDHLATTLAELCRRHELPPTMVDQADLDGGKQGLIAASELTGDPPAPVSWAEMAERVAGELDGMAAPAAAVGRLPRAGDDPCAGLRDEVAAAEADLEQAKAEAADAEARASEAEARAADRGKDLYDCECDNELEPVLRRPAPGREPDDIDDDPNRFYLVANENPYAPMRSNGKRGWYRPYRLGPIRGLVIHTAEGVIDPALDPAGSVARYFAETERTASAHAVTDSLRRVDLVPDRYTAFHARGGNANGLGLEIGYHAHRWGSDPALETGLLEQAALWAAEKCFLYDIPRARVSASQWATGQRGFISHAELDPARRSDPGPEFPWDRFLALVEGHVGRWRQ